MRCSLLHALLIHTTWFKQDNILSYNQIIRITKIFAALGIEKIKITGGEPTIRPQLDELVKSLSCINGISNQ